MRACAIILAAGFSTRMAPMFKPLLPIPFPWAEESAVASLCRRFREEGALPVVVGGNEAEKTRREACASGGIFVRNPHPEQGMFSSITAGLAALPDECTHFFMQPSDVPLVRRMTLRLLLERAAESNAVLVPSFRGKPGHPPLFPAGAKALLAGRSWAGGLREAMAHLPCEPVPTADSFMLRDMDTPEEYQSLRLLAPSMDVLTAEEAWELLNLLDIPAKGKMHALAVGAVAEAFAACLPSLSPETARAGGLAHDICKGQRNHEAAAGHYFRSRGMERMAWLVESHRDIILPPDAPFTEREAVFLADKFVHGSRFIPLAERFRQKLLLYSHDLDACEAIRKRRGHALELLGRFERESGKNAASLAQEALDRMQIPDGQSL